MAPPAPLLGFPAPGADQRKTAAGVSARRNKRKTAAGVSARRNKRKTAAGVGNDGHHRPETEAEATHRIAARRRRIISSATVELPHPAGQFVEQTECGSGSGFLCYNEQRNNYQRQQPPAAAQNGGTAARPIVIDDEEEEVLVVAPAAAELGGGSPCPEQPAVMPRPACGEKKKDKEEGAYGGRYERFSAYLPPPLPDAADEEDDALRLWSAAAVPRYYSPVDVFFGTEDGAWIY